MKSNYDILGNHIRLIDTRNRESITDRVLGINIDKFFMPSVANVIGTDLSKYKLITKGKFACNPMHVGRDERLPVALYDEEKPAIVSPAYFMFEVIDNSILKEDYLMMWFRRPEFDRICWLHTDGSVRGGITWDDICRLELPIPPIENQLEIVNSYKAITERIALKQKINDNLEATAQAYFDSLFLMSQNLIALWLILPLSILFDLLLKVSKLVILKWQRFQQMAVFQQAILLSLIMVEFVLLTAIHLLHELLLVLKMVKLHT